MSASRIASPGTIVNTSGPLGNDDDDDDDDDDERLYLRANAQLNQTKSNFFARLENLILLPFCIASS